MTDITNERVRALVDAVPRGLHVLDVGCVQHDADAAAGPNWLHQHLVARSASVVGIDILSEDIGELQARGYDVREADAETFDLDQQFDVVVAGELIEHLSRPGQFLERAREHLRPDGRLVVTTPNPWAFVHVRRAALGAGRWNDEHTCWFDAQTLRQLLQRHGFDARIEHVRPTDAGVTRVLYDAGAERIGGTSLLAVATPSAGASLAGDPGG
jgi:2-polyprenyl-3-methyl-5-hydroxy-6-metoxy-1,4-benzoquinol methylase